MGNNWVAWKIAEWLGAQDDQVVAAIVHPPEVARYREEILQSLRLPDSQVFESHQLHDEQVLDALRHLQPEMGVSVYFGYVLRAEFLDLLPAGCINVHPAFLPYNRGAYPNVWSIVDGSPAGVTIHFVDEGIDTGDILVQKEVAVEPVDTGESLYRKLEREAVSLFREAWPQIRTGDITGAPQDKEQGTFHRIADVRRIDEIDLDAEYSARELIDVLRARTFPPHPGTYIRLGDRKVFLRLKLIEEGEQEGDG